MQSEKLRCLARDISALGQQGNTSSGHEANDIAEDTVREITFKSYYGVFYPITRETPRQGFLTFTDQMSLRGPLNIKINCYMVILAWKYDVASIYIQIEAINIDIKVYMQD